MRKVYDVAVVGLGAVGGAALYNLAKRKARVLGIDRFSPPHPFGSSHGDTRITRQAIGEGECYTPLSLRSYELFREIGALAGADLLQETGGLIMTSGNSNSLLHGRNDFLEETIRAARKYDISHSVMNAREIAAAFPQFKLSGDEIGYYEPAAGFLRPENCVRAQLLLAEQLGVDLRRNEVVTDLVIENDNSVIVRTDKKEYHASKVVLSIGSWVKRFLGEKYKGLFSVSRQVLYWFDASESHESFLPGRFPIFIWAFGNGDWVYGFPAVDGYGGGVKVASEQHDTEVEPDVVSRNVTEEEIGDMHNRYIAGRFHTLYPRCIKTVVCLYTKTPDSNFIIDVHPENQNIIIASPCSGHGFKHSAAVGEVLAQMALGEPRQIDISPFSIKRFFIEKAKI